MQRVLGLDLGSRTCGVAVSDELGMLAHGVETYRFSENAYKKCAFHIQSLVEKYQVHTIVLGLPKHMNGDFKKRLEEMMDVEVILEDERMTTVIATQALLMGDVSRKKRKQVVDKMAAVEILQGYLDKSK